MRPLLYEHYTFCYLIESNPNPNPNLEVTKC